MSSNSKVKYKQMAHLKVYQLESGHIEALLV